MATQILAIEDSATMRKILEITFSGTDYQLTLATSGDDGVAKARGGGFALAICDNSLAPSGYDVARDLKATGVPVLFLSSKQNPYDAGQGGSAGVDDHMDKPFDTTQLLDRVTKLVSGGAGASAAAPAPAPAAAAPAAAPAAAAAAAKGRTMAFGGGAPAPAPGPAPKVAGFGAQAPKPAAAPAPAPAPAPAARPAPAAAPAPAPAPAARPAAAATAALTGQVAARVGEMGLTPQQAEAVMALSRDLVEKIVWEVVPVLAETLIREEIARLTK